MHVCGYVRLFCNFFRIEYTFKFAYIILYMRMYVYVRLFRNHFSFWMFSKKSEIKIVQNT